MSFSTCQIATVFTAICTICTSSTPDNKAITLLKRCICLMKQKTTSLIFRLPTLQIFRLAMCLPIQSMMTELTRRIP